MKKQLSFLISFAISGQIFGQCAPSTAHAFLDINNVRARLNNSMSSFWNEMASSQYEVPKGSGKHSLSAGSFWIGGLDSQGEVRVAAQRFRSQGDDYFAGPISIGTAETDSLTCGQYDRIWKLNRWQVAEFRDNYNSVGYIAPADIMEWPAHGNVASGFASNLAPFRDIDGDGIYNPETGDYPAFAFDGEPDMENDLLGDQVLWWIVNDTGNEHKESGGLAIGVELHCMAYAFKSCDVLNDQTFYRYTAINRGTNTLTNTYFGSWADVDLGFANDDFVGSDVGRGMGYCYNGLAIDGTSGPTQYGAKPPAVGMDILRGPLQDADEIDNDADGTVDNEHHNMSRFLYHDNDGSATGDPTTSLEFYNYMSGFWRDNTPMIYGGTGHPTGGGNPDVPCNYMFPGDSDPTGIGTGGVPQQFWDETSANNVPYDKRFLLSSGPFTFAPGDVRSLHQAVVWARDTVVEVSDWSTQIGALQTADDYVQAAFDAKFQNLACCPPSVEISFQRPRTFHFHFSSIAEGESYLWNFGDGQTSTERFPFHVYEEYGSYEVCLTVTNACGTDTHCQFIEIEVGSTGIEEQKTISSLLSIAPNPSTAGFQLTLSKGVMQSFRLFDTMGKMVLTQTFAVGTAAVSISTMGIAPGMYVAHVQTDKGVAVQRVVVSR